jgi:hypothetical protein
MAAPFIADGIRTCLPRAAAAAGQTIPEISQT